MKTVELPFRAAFGDAITSGRKTATTRNQKYGRKGDMLETTWGPIQLGEVYRTHLGKVRDCLWQDEGCSSPGEFEQIWRTLHRGHYDERKLVWVHRFQFVGAVLNPMLWGNENQPEPER